MMRRLATIALLLLAAVPVAAQTTTTASTFEMFTTDPFGCNGAKRSHVYFNTTSNVPKFCDGTLWQNFASLSGTTNTLAKFTSSSTIGNATPLTSQNTVATDNSTRFLTIAGTLPSGNTAEVDGTMLDVTSSGSAAFPQIAALSVLRAGYTGASDTFTSFVGNISNSTAVDTIGNAHGSSALWGGTENTSTGDSFGVAGYADNNGGGKMVGVLASARNADVAFGKTGTAKALYAIVNGNPATGSSAGFFTVGGGANVIPDMPSSAMIQSYNGSSGGTGLRHLTFFGAGPTAVFNIGPSGEMWAGKSKTLTDAAAAVAFATVTLPSGSATGGQIDYCIEVVDATPNYQNRCGGLVYTAVNKAGTLMIQCNRPGGSATLDNTTDFIATSSGTMTETFTCVDGGSGVLQFKVTADSSLTPTTERINYSLRQWGNAAVVFTPQ